MPIALINTARTAIVSAAFVLTGCTGMRIIDTQVNSFAPQQIAPGTSYQFERLPSQAANPTYQDKLEILAKQALGKVGLTQKAGAPLRVQITATQRQETTSTDGDWHLGFGFGWAFGHHTHGFGHRGGLFPGLDIQTIYLREVSLVVRDGSGTVVFESHASNDDVWSDSDAVLAAMLEAALEGFPAPPAGVRQVHIEIPR